MRKAAAVCLILLIAWISAWGQKPAELPVKPISPRAGRMIHLREDFRLTDESGDFYLKYPQSVKMAPDGSFFLLDREQIIRLDATGRFLGNLFRKGQGPGELSFVSGMEATTEGLTVHNNGPNKLVRFDAGGKYKDEVSLQKIGSSLDFLGLSDGRAIGLQMRFPPPGAGLEVKMRDIALLAVSYDGLKSANLGAFPIRFLQAGGAMLRDRSLGVVMGGRYAAIVHTKEYAIKIVDLQSPKPPRTIGRKYKKVPAPKGYASGGKISPDKITWYTLPGADFMYDIEALHVFKDLLWVQTSTIDPKKGVLIDVFDVDGRYLDAFYLNIPGRLLNIQGDALFVRESAADDTLRIVRYKVVG